MNSRKIPLVLLSGWLLILSGCFLRQSIEEQIYRELESILAVEEDFAKQQDPLLQLEEKDHELYSEIVATGLNNSKKIAELAEKGIEIAEKRQELLDIERESIIASAEEFEKTTRLFSKIKDEELKKLVEQLYSVMSRRYRVHEQLYEEYSTGIQLDRNFYRLLQHEDISFTTLETRIQERNEVYRRVYSLNERFNELTAEYNLLKGKFYQQAGISIPASSR